MLRWLMIVIGLAMAGTGASAAVAPDPAELQYGPVPAWVVPPPAPTDTATPPEAPIRLIYTDYQIRMTPAGRETFSVFRYRILKPEALAFGNVRVSWRPSDGTATVNRLNIIRGGEVIDVLKTSKFETIQREGGLEQSILTGMKTAQMQIPGLQIGDEVDYAVTVRSRDPTLGDHNFGFVQLPLEGALGVVRYRFLWPQDDKIVWQTTSDVPKAQPVTANGQSVVTYELRDPATITPIEGAVPRANIRRLIEFSDYAGWNDVSARIWPLFDKASVLPATSPLRAEIAKIAAASSDPQKRVEAALRLVQEQVRYVYIGLNAGNFLPASVDDTWARRFGDCKAKTVMLLAILRELGIEAEPVLVSSNGGDVLNGRLPDPSLFDHVLVRAKVGGTSYWLDGTRAADRVLARMPAPPYVWVLPLRQAGATLEAVAPKAPDFPQTVEIVDIDATAGVTKPATVKVTMVFRQDDAYVIRTQLNAMAPQDAQKALRDNFAKDSEWIEPDDVSWRYDEATATLTLTLKGHGTPPWTGNAASGFGLVIPGAGFTPPSPLKRPKDQDQSAPWATTFPRFLCWATTIRLPPTESKMMWTYSAAPMNVRLGDTIYWRVAGMKDNVVRTVMSKQVYLRELDAAQVTALNAGIPGFNNAMSLISQVRQWPGMKPVNTPPPFADDVDWAANPRACVAPPQPAPAAKPVQAPASRSSSVQS